MPKVWELNRGLRKITNYTWVNIAEDCGRSQHSLGKLNGGLQKISRHI